MKARSLGRRAVFISVLVAVLVAILGNVCSAQRPNGPCDIYASATPCVAAYSTTRALFNSYNGSLYQVTRQSDNTTLNVGVNSNGYANAAAQDTFCANTTCTISELYDQSSSHNNLTPAPPGGNGRGAGSNGYDLPVNASALPLTAGGQKVYGMFFQPGMGYRNDATVNVAVNGQPEGVYMVTSGTYFNGGCCFDFGNAETNNDDNGAGHMDAINIICGGTPCSPVVGLDMENGIYGGLSAGNGNKFVTAMGTNDGQHNYSIYQGNAQSGSLTTTGSVALPSGYSPMHQEGAIILGIGGDNSITSVGAFFEGVMTKGVPTSTVMNSVQANIVAAGYTADGPCDIYATSTPCVAAYSTTRALFDSYNGSLYQVTRQSDETALNIGVSSTGYANASAQDTFCANTTCTITELYDQTSNHNNLTPAPPGAGGGSNDLPANASALPVFLGGQKVYGMYFQPGMGYRNDSTINVAVNGQPEGVYMLTSGTHVNGGCCFDFGNAETNNEDNGAGHMDAINIMCSGNPCTPAAGLDLDDGIYGGLSAGTGNQFVTTMGANDGQHNYAIYQGNAQSGSLATTGSVTLPSGYSPMHQEGAILLGIGGANNTAATGSFFEGVMTNGVPTSAVMNSVQTNIATAAYAGGCYVLDNELTGNELWQTGNVYNSISGVYYVVDVPNTWPGNESIWHLYPQPNGYYIVSSDNQDGQLWLTGNSYGGQNTGYYYVVTVPSSWTGDQRFWQVVSAGDGNVYLVSKYMPSVALQETGNAYNGLTGVYYDAATPTSWYASYQRFSLKSVTCP